MSDPRIDAYIAKAQPFAQPILKKLREIIHKACPDVTETIKWGMPSFEYMGPMCGVASFKQHCSFGFWKASLLNDPEGYLQERSAQGGEGMGHLGRITTLKDIPPSKILIDFIKQSMKLNESGIKVIKTKSTTKKPTPIPPAMKSMLEKNKKVNTNFNNFSPSQQREYIDWIADAKTDVTREKRLADAKKWIGENKIRNWKYLAPKK